MVEDRFLKRLRKKARKGLRGWPIATVAFYGPNLSQATKVAVSIVPSENAEMAELRDWKVDRGDIRSDPGVARTRKESITTANGVRFASFGTDEIGLLGNECIKQRRPGRLEPAALK